MLDDFVKRMVVQLQSYHLIDDDETAEYEYVLIGQMESSITYLTILMIAAVSGYLLETLGFLIVFFTLRKRTGGFHLNTFLGCYLGTVMIYCFLLWVNVQLIIPKTCFYLLTFFSSIVIVFIGAVNHPNVGWSEAEKEESAACARWILGREIIALLFVCTLGTDKVLEQFLMSGIILCASLMLLAKIKRILAAGKYVVLPAAKVFAEAVVMGFAVKAISDLCN